MPRWPGSCRAGPCTPTCRFGVAPGSRQVLQMADPRRLPRRPASPPARGMLETACGFCIGNSQSPQTGAVSLRTSNRNFEGRSGTKDAQVYLVSPEMAAVAAVTGEIADPREPGIDYPAVKMPAQLPGRRHHDHLPRRRGSRARSSAGPTSATPPVNDALPEQPRRRGAASRSATRSPPTTSCPPAPG